MHQHEVVMRWKRFPRHWPFVRGIYWLPVDSSHKGPVIRGFGVFMVSLLDELFVEQTDEFPVIWDPHEAHYMTSLWWGTWWRNQMEKFSALLALFAGNSPVTGEFPAQRPVTRSFDVFCDLPLNKRKKSKHSWIQTPSRSLWRHCNESETLITLIIWRQYNRIRIVFQHWDAFVHVTEIFILVPALLDLKGNLEMTLAARLSTQVTAAMTIWGSLKKKEKKKTIFTNPRMPLLHIPQCSIQNRNVDISVLNRALCDMEQVHSGICELGQYEQTWAGLTQCGLNKMADILHMFFANTFSRKNFF